MPYRRTEETMTTMASNPWKLCTLLALAAAGLSRGCDCSDDPFSPLKPWSCEEEGRRPGPDDQACGNARRFLKGECQPLRCDAGEQPPGCCPGMICTQGGECLVPPSRLTLCENDFACDEGQLCLSRPLINPNAKTCGFPPLGPGGACPEGSRPFNGRCVGGTTPPCGGDCPPQTVCNIDTNRCEDPPSLPATDHGCRSECGEAQLLVYADPDLMLWDQCCEIGCACATLPPLLPGRWGRYSDLVASDEGLYVSAYDGTYGDLVMGLHGSPDAPLLRLDYVDGLPSGGTVVADPAGPRGGRDGPGPDVGTYTAIALQDGEPRIVYYDRDGANLKYAAYDSLHQSWVVGLIDDGRDVTGLDTGDVGRFTSLVIDDAGIAHVTYYAHRVLRDGALVTGPMYARATGPAPLLYEDWERLPIETVSSCNGLCAPGQLCALVADAPTCVAPRDDCAAACACDEACVEVGAAPVCRRQLPIALVEPCDGSCPTDFACVADPASGTICLPLRSGACSSCDADELCVDDGAGNAVCRTETPYSSITGLPDGVGLFTSVAIFDGRIVVVYYDRLLRQLRGARANFGLSESLADFTAGPLPVGCGPGADTGQWASLAVSPEGDTLGVAYQADGGESLWYYSGTDLSGGTTEPVDDGLRPVRLDLVGAGADLAFDTNRDQPLIAYADQTTNDLLLARRTSGTWQTHLLLTDGAHGSFASVALSGRTAWVSAYQRLRDQRDRDQSRLVIVVVDLDALP